MTRALIGTVVAACIAFMARRANSLNSSGAIAATIIGAIAVAAGWSWGALLIVYFVSSSALSRVGRTAKEMRTAPIVEKSGARDAMQVLANGAMFAGAALAMIARPHVHWIALGAGALAASASDTWATEAGTLWGGEPRSLVGWRAVAAGTSGAVTPIGSLAAVAGALFMAIVVRLLGWEWRVAFDVAVGGIAGALADSLLGATIQGRRWCETCQRETERSTHDCGTVTRPRWGLMWLDNDLVNFFSTLAGGLVAVWLTH